MWLLVYFGPLDVVSVDQGTKYVYAKMRSNYQASGVVLKQDPFETPGEIGTVEQYHAPFRTAFDKIRAEM